MRLLSRVAVAFGVLLLLLLFGVLALQMQPRSAVGWKQFSIGPATGQNVIINSGAIRSDGITVRTLLGIAYGIPAVRIIGPEWISATRYSLQAEVDGPDAETFRALLQQELKTRLKVETHTEDRPFDVYVLTAPKFHGLQSESGDANTAIHEWNAELHNASMDRLAGALQTILGKPVLNETGVGGTYRIDFSWGENRASSIEAALASRFGLHLSEETRSLESLVVDNIRPGASLTLFARTGHWISGAPHGLRERIAGALSIH